MPRFLIVLSHISLLTGLLWPVIGKLGLGHLRGDISFTRGHATFYFPLLTSLVLSVCSAWCSG